MYIEEKINLINHRLTVLEELKNVAIWGGGIHTRMLFEKTEVLSYNISNIVDADEQKHGTMYFGYLIQSPNEIEWDTIDAVIISVHGKDKEIMDTLINKISFVGKIITFYDHNEAIPFYMLYSKKENQICFRGDYKSWLEAISDCHGYQDQAILDTAVSAINKVLDGEALWERDGCLFYEQKFVYQICTTILRCAIQNKNQGVRILDIGGALGSTYFQNRKLLCDVNYLEYIVAEQKGVAEYGHKNLEDNILKFINSENSFENLGEIDIVLMSGSLQYIYPYEDIILKIKNVNPKYIILDRIFVGNRMRICKESIPEYICVSSYPVLIFSESEIIKMFQPNFILTEKDNSSVDFKIYFEDEIVDSKYYVFQRI